MRNFESVTDDAHGDVEEVPAADVEEMCRELTDFRRCTSCGTVFTLGAHLGERCPHGHDRDHLDESSESFSNWDDFSMLTPIWKAVKVRIGHRLVGKAWAVATTNSHTTTWPRRRRHSAARAL